MLKDFKRKHSYKHDQVLRGFSPVKENFGQNWNKIQKIKNVRIKNYQVKWVIVEKNI